MQSSSTSLVNQPSAIPTRKVTVGGLGALATFVIISAANQCGVNMPTPVASFLTGAIGYGLSYLAKERGVDLEFSETPFQATVFDSNNPSEHKGL